MIRIEKIKEIHAKAVSDIILDNLYHVNIHDYDLEKIEKTASSFKEENILEYMGKRNMLVALDKDNVVGTLSIVKSWDNIEGHYVFLTIFVSRDFHKQGIGKALVLYAEDSIIDKAKQISIPSSLYAHKFYHKLGYMYVNHHLIADEHGCIPMVKRINL